MSLQTLQKGLSEIKSVINNMTDKELKDKLYDMGFLVVPQHFIIELRTRL